MTYSAHTTAAVYGAGSTVAVGNPAASVGPGTGHDAASSGAMAGAAEGASSGAMVGSYFGPIGTVVGAVVGAVVGGVAGWVSGAFEDKAKKHLKKAAKWANAGKDREAAVARANMLRTYRIARANAVVQIGQEDGGMQGSATGATSSLGAQYAFGDAYFGGQVHIQKEYARQMKKAQKNQNKAGMIQGYLDAATSLASTFASYGMNFGGGASTVSGSSSQFASYMDSPMSTQPATRMNA